MRLSAAIFEMGMETMEVSAITGYQDLVMFKRSTYLKAENLAKKLG